MVTPRKIVAGSDGVGRWHVDADTNATAAPAAFPFWQVWASDTPRTGPSEQAAEASMFPPVGGLRMGIGEFPPASAIAATTDSAQDDAATRYMTHGDRMHDLDLDPDTGAHRTDTVDMMFLLSGSVELTVGEDEHVTLRAGDALVLTGAQHSWRNDGTVPARYGIVMYGASTLP